MKVLYLGSNEKKNSGKESNKIEGFNQDWKQDRWKEVGNE